MNERPPMNRQPTRQPWPLSRFLHERAIAMGMALERSSQTAYNSHLNSYIAFCHIHQRPITSTVDTLSFFIVYMSAHIKPDSVAVYLAGICNKLETEFPDVRRHRNDPIVKRALAGCIKRARQQPSRKSPLDPTHLLSAMQNLTSSSPHDDLLFAALLVTSFHALMRLGELVWPNTIQLQSLRKVALCRSPCTTENDFSFILPTHKALKAGHGNEVLMRAFTPTINPLPLLLHYICSRDLHFFYAPELWLTRDGAIPTRSWFMRHFRQFFGSEFAGHSMRSGGATTLTLISKPPHVIQTLGRWASEEWQKYVRHHAFLQQALLHGGSTP